MHAISEQAGKDLRSPCHNTQLLKSRWGTSVHRCFGVRAAEQGAQSFVGIPFRKAPRECPGAYGPHAFHIIIDCPVEHALKLAQRDGDKAQDVAPIAQWSA